MARMQPTYHLPPNFSVPPDGPFQLGTVIRDFDHHANMRPLNQSRKSRIEITSEIYTDRMGGFEATRARLKSGELGIWAKFLGIGGVGAEAKVSAERTENDVYKFESVKTTFFYPESSYISESMELSDVKDYLTATNYKKPVFLVTGLKVAEGVSVQHNDTMQIAAVAHVGFHNPDAVSIQAGPGSSVTGKSSLGHSFSSSSDMVVGIQCIKIYYKTRWLGEGRKLEQKAYLRGAVFLDDNNDTVNLEVDNYTFAREDDFNQSINEITSETATERQELWLVTASKKLPLEAKS